MREKQSKATQERHERMLNELFKLPGNDRCADCTAKSNFFFLEKNIRMHNINCICQILAGLLTLLESFCAFVAEVYIVRWELIFQRLNQLAWTAGRYRKFKLVAKIKAGNDRS